MNTVPLQQTAQLMLRGAICREDLTGTLLYPGQSVSLRIQTFLITFLFLKRNKLTLLEELTIHLLSYFLL